MEREIGNDFYSCEINQKSSKYALISYFEVYRFYLVNDVRFDNLSGMNKVFLFKGKIVLCFHEYFACLRAYL